MVSRKPAGRTNHQYIPMPKPELLIRSVKTKSTLWCLSGTMIRIPMMIAVPITCQKTEMLEKTATRWCE